MFRPIAGRAGRAALVALAVTAHAATASAGGSSTDGDVKADSQKQAARALFAQGVKLTESGDNPGALAAFRSAYDKSPSFRVLYNIGQLCTRVADPVCAVRAYEQYLSDGGGDVPARRRADVEAELAKLRRVVATITITVNLAGADVSIDEAPSGRSPLPGPVVVAAGTHKIAAMLEGKSVDRTVKVAGAEAITLDLAFPEKPPAPAEPPPKPAPAKPDTAEGLRTDPDAHPRHGVPVVPWVVTGGLAIATTVTAVLAESSYSTYTNKRESFPVTRSALDDAQGSARTLFLVTGVFAALTVASAVVAAYFTFRPTGGGPRIGVGPGSIAIAGVLP